VNTQPGAGTPKDWEKMGGGYDARGKLLLGKLPSAEEFGGGWDYNYDEVLRGGHGRSVHLKKTAGSTSWGMNWDEDEGAGVFPNAYFFYLPRMCNHCTEPACVEACPSEAMFKREEDGLVLRDEDRCQSNQVCAQACPYKKIYFNAARGVSQHCIGCFPRLEQGVAPACARNCPGRLIFVGMLEDEKDPVNRLVYEWEVALPLHAEFGTEPNVFYVPPLSPYRLREDRSIDTETMRIPPEYLESLFGPRVHEVLATLRSEIEQVREGGSSELLDTLIVYQWKTLFGPFAEEPAVVEAAKGEAR
jgi:ethylbenzene hydroxylase subunit beta/complex iron-sulfur molybdoenzyme family reductase subunit beta